MNYQEFAQKIKAKYPDYNDMDDRELAQKMVAKFPEYSDVTFDDSTTPQPSPEPTVADQQKKPITDANLFGLPDKLEKAIFPKYGVQAKGERQEGMAGVRQAIGQAGEGLTAGFRSLGAIGTGLQAKMAGKDNQTAINEALTDLGKTKSDLKGVGGFVENTIEDVAMLPSLMVGGPLITAGKSALAKAGSTALFGALEGATSAGVHQAQNYAETGNVNLGEAAVEVGVSTLFPALSSGAGSLTKKAIEGLNIKGIIAKFTNINEEFIERAAKKGELEKISKAYVAANGNPENMADDVLKQVGELRVRAQNEMDAVQSGLNESVEKSKSIFNVQKNAAVNTAENDLRNIGTNLKQSTKNIDENLKTGLTGAQDNYQKGIASTVASNRTAGAVQDLNSIKGSDVGANIQTAAEESRSKVGQKFGEWQDKIMNKYGVGDAPLKAAGDTHPLVSKMNEIYSEIGYNPQIGYSKNLKYGSLPIDRKVISGLEQIENDLFDANTIGDAITQKRAIGQTIKGWDDGTKELFKKGEAGDLLLKRLYEKMDNEIESQIEQFGNKQLSRLWKANNAVYKVGRDALEQVRTGINMGKVGNIDTYYDKIKGIGVQGLEQLKAATSVNKNVKPIWEELQNGYFDSLILNSMKEGNFDVAAFKKIYHDKSREGIRDILLSPKQRMNIESALNKYGDALDVTTKSLKDDAFAKKLSLKETADLKKSEVKLNKNKSIESFKSAMESDIESETAKAHGKLSEIANKYRVGGGNVNDIGDELIGKGKTSDDQKKAAINAINAIGGKTGKAKTALAQMGFIEEMLNIPKGERLSNKIVDAYAGKMLDLTSDGKLANFKRFTTGSVIGGATVGGGIYAASKDLEDKTGIPGLSNIGLIGGFILGNYAQSPASAVAMYKAINALSPILSAGGKAVGSTINNKLTRQAVRYGALSGMEEE